LKPLTFALDFDDTFTADPLLWSRFATDARARGHRLCLVTARRDTEENRQDINATLDHWKCQMPIVFSSLGSKLAAVQRHGLEIDIWIDDDPTSLVHGH
jgi:hypothetical protein